MGGKTGMITKVEKKNGSVYVVDGDSQRTHFFMCWNFQ